MNFGKLTMTQIGLFFENQLKLKIDKNRKDCIVGGDINYVWETWENMVTGSANESIGKSKPVKEIIEILG